VVVETIQNLSSNLPYLFFPLLFLLSFLLYRVTRFILARLLYWVALRTKTIYDDLFVDRLQPFRFSWLLPLLLIFFSADSLFPDYIFVKKLALVLSIWFLVKLLIAIMSGINDVYKNNPRYTGVSVAGYTGLIQVLIVVAGIVLAISYLTDIELVTLLSGAGAWLAVLLLIFRDTILSFLASIQISTQDLIREGDMVDIPSFEASGIVSEIDLSSITVQNFDNTITTIPTSKIEEVGFKNYRIVLESGLRRMKRSIRLDTNSIKFADAGTIRKLKNTVFINTHIPEILSSPDVQTTNLQIFLAYTEKYLTARKEIRKKRYPFLVRALEPTSKGLPIEVYIYVKTSSWEHFEAIQSDIIIHLLAALKYFDLKTFQLGGEE
jgi:miniconductance mechanosensitive channel